MAYLFYVGITEAVSKGLLLTAKNAKNAQWTQK